MAVMNRVFEYLVGPNFQTRLAAVRRETGWKGVSLSPTSAGFQLTYGGREYELVAEESGQSVILTASSNGRFARRMFPPVIEKVLLRRNRDLEKFDWKLYHGSSSTWAVLICSVKLDKWDGNLMKVAANAMLEEVEQFDNGLREHGLLE